VDAPPLGPPGSTLTVREVRRSDKDSFSEVMLGSYGPFERMMGLGRSGTAEFGALFRPGLWYLLRFLRILGLAPIRMYVAADGGTVVGTTLVLPWPRSGYIMGVGVRPSHRRRGLAGQLIGRAEQFAGRRGRPWAVLDVEEENHPAVTLYLARQYTTFLRVVWLSCASPRTVASAPRANAAVRAVGKAGRRSAAAWCAPRVPPVVRETVPPSAQRLTHLESLGQFPGVVRETWSAGPPDGPTAYLSAAWRGSDMPGVLFVPAVDPRAPHDDLVRLFQDATAWLSSRGSPTVVVAVPDALASTLSVLTELGFEAQMTTLAMSRRLGAPGAPSAPPKSP